MSSAEEELKAIHHAVQQAKKTVLKLETIKSVSKLHKSQEYELDMAKDLVKQGESILKENGFKP